MDLGEFINYTLVEDFEFEIVYDDIELKTNITM
jgi:hypothetical protein